MKLELSGPLPEAVASKFREAKSKESLTFSHTELATICTSSGIPFQLRYCPALAKKPTQNDKPTPSEKKPDPFLDPPDDLLITRISSATSSHVLVLNKYPVIANHFIIATREDKPQTHVLEAEDLEATYLCLHEWEKDGGGKRLFTFFNSGEHSGASQPHRHLQFLPIESMKEGDEDGEWQVLSDRISGRSRRYSAGAAATGPSPQTELPFACFSRAIPQNASSDQLFTIYTTLLSEATVAARSYAQAHPTDFALPTISGESIPAPISYNLAMTTSSMVLCPRSSEGVVLKQQDGSEAGYVALNGTILGGTLMVKLKEEWDILRGDSTALDLLLAAIGIPTSGSSSEEVVENESRL
ncbi:HIT-like protein [Rhizodiscina lignyota]|uniref:HIT-like protein n=1 Tax=Rhizodiscina lignyota TaxID=1504668 RepID=A0A9P4M2F1_9PEZI|nr:HIT-like protein [Rhizodiscina lignyota]